MSGPLLVARLPSGPAYTVVLICHVAAVLISLVAVVASAVAAARVLGSGGRPLAPSVRTYFAPGVNWAGRALYLVPVFGATLVGLSGGVYPLDATWVLCGIGLWVAATVVAEAALWPAERRVQRALAASPASAGPAGGPPPAVAAAAPPAVAAAARQACRAVCLSASGVLVIVLAAMVVMFAKP